jgi:oxygen-independent coproporphyrinogen-3 oxidase
MRTDLSPAATVVDLIARYDVNAPRYTSYPTAAQFTAAVGPTDRMRWLSALPDEPVSLYMHIPFCKRLCWYCGCNTRAMNRPALISTYVDQLLIEAERVSAAAGRRLSIRFLHLGGGTPNMLAPSDLERLMEGLSAIFDLAGVDEIAAELDPEVLTPDWIAAAGRIGLTRASLGVQDLSPRVQAAVNRPESFETIRAVAEGLRQAGVRSLNLDLMYGLPLQTVDDVLATLDQVITLRPDRIALFGYAHVPWMKPHQKLIHTADLPGPRTRFVQSRAAEQFLAANGWRTIGLDHFALPHDALAMAAADGSLRRNFQGYTTDQAQSLIGLGVSAISRFRQGYVQNPSQERDWRAAVDAGGLPAARGVVMTGDDAFLAAIIERLMCDAVVDVAHVAARCGADVRDTAFAWPTLDRLETDGLIIQDGATVRLTDVGRPFARIVSMAWDPTASPAQGRHARAV